MVCAAGKFWQRLAGLNLFAPRRLPIRDAKLPAPLGLRGLFYFPSNAWKTSMQDVVISTAQLRAAMGMLGWTAERLSQASGISTVSIWRKSAKPGRLEGNPDTVSRIILALNRAGIVFADGGVRRR